MGSFVIKFLCVFYVFIYLKKNRFEDGLIEIPNGTMKTDNSRAKEKLTILMIMSEVPVSSNVTM